MPTLPEKQTAAPKATLAVAAAALLLVGLYVWYQREQVPAVAGIVAVTPPALPGNAAQSPVAPAAGVAGGPAIAGAPGVAPLKDATQDQAVKPSFDVVRVGNSGSAVIAGRAAPGAEVLVFEGGHEIARAQADRRGEFVALPAARLEPGGRSLTLASRDVGRAGGQAGGGAEVKGEEAVVLDVPQPGPGAAPAVAVLVPPQAPPRLLGQPATGEAVPHGPRLDTVDYDDKGALRFAGQGVPGSTLRLYVDGGAVGDAQAGADGRWALQPGDSVGVGVHRLRLDQLRADGGVAARVELPFQRAPLSGPDAASVAEGRVVVQPGGTLWRLARQAYGRGVQYTVIFLANRDQIRDARLIYPGQTFTVPAP